MNQWVKSLRSFGNNSTLLYNVRIFLAFVGVTLIPYLLDLQVYTIPLSLGIIAAGLSDIDDRFSVRLLNSFYTYIGFFITSVSIFFLFPYPILFAFGLVFSCVFFILLGSLGRRYTSISYGCLIISVYSMLGYDLFEEWYLQAGLLVLGAMWYGFLSTIAFLLFPVQEVQKQLATSYSKLGDLLFAKSNLFDVDMTNQSYRQNMVDFSLENGQLINLFNNMRVSLLTRLKGDRGQKDTRRSLHYYFVAQDIHERVDSAHIEYQKLSQTFQHSDILFRFQRILSMQGKSCKDLSQAILNQEQYHHSSRFKSAFENLRASLDKLKAENLYEPTIIKALYSLSLNLKAIDAQFVSLASAQQIQHKQLQQAESQLLDDELKTLPDIISRIKQNLSPESVLFRHAIRLSVVLLVAYIFIQLTDISHGYWILLTALFVIQPNFNATKRRLNLRIMGTLFGVAIGYAILVFVPSLEGQLLLLVISGVLFFELRSKQYAQATAFITILAMVNFNLNGGSPDIAISRLIDTMIGCFFAWIAMISIWPDWKFRRLNLHIFQALHNEYAYLSAAIQQYHFGRNNALEYRSIRRQAHNSDANLASLISTLATEPHFDSDLKNACFEFLCLNHTFLSYISALSAHREKLENTDCLQFLTQVLQHTQAVLINDAQLDKSLIAQLQSIRKQLNNLDAQAELNLIVLQQIYLILNLLPNLSHLKQKLVLNHSDTDASALASI